MNSYSFLHQKGKTYFFLFVILKKSEGAFFTVNIIVISLVISATQHLFFLLPSFMTMYNPNGYLSILTASPGHFKTNCCVFNQLEIIMYIS